MFKLSKWLSRSYRPRDRGEHPPHAVVGLVERPGAGSGRSAVAVAAVGVGRFRELGTFMAMDEGPMHAWSCAARSRSTVGSDDPRSLWPGGQPIGKAGRSRGRLASPWSAIWVKNRGSTVRSDPALRPVDSVCMSKDAHHERQAALVILIAVTTAIRLLCAVSPGPGQRRGLSLPLCGPSGAELLRPSADDGLGRDGRPDPARRGPCGLGAADRLHRAVRRLDWLLARLTTPILRRRRPDSSRRWP